MDKPLEVKVSESTKVTEVVNLNLFTKEKLFSFAFSVVVTLVLFVDTNFLHGQLLTGMWLFTAMVFGLVLTAIMLIAGYAVIKALVHVGAGLSLLIFLGQAYCDLPTHTANSALAMQIGIGILYIFYDFSTSFWETCAAYLKKLGKEKESWQGVSVILIFSLFTLFFVWNILQVVGPIIQNLCIYK